MGGWVGGWVAGWMGGQSPPSPPQDQNRPCVVSSCVHILATAIISLSKIEFNFLPKHHKRRWLLGLWCMLLKPKRLTLGAKHAQPQGPRIVHFGIRLQLGDLAHKYGRDLVVARNFIFLQQRIVKISVDAFTTRYIAHIEKGCPKLNSLCDPLLH